MLCNWSVVYPGVSHQGAPVVSYQGAPNVSIVPSTEWQGATINGNVAVVPTSANFVGSPGASKLNLSIQISSTVSPQEIKLLA